MEIKLLTNTPHSEDDIMSNRPIRFDMGSIVFDFGLLSFNDFAIFDKYCKILGLSSLVSHKQLSDDEFQSKINEIYGNYPELYLFDEKQLPLLPAFIMKFAKFQNKKNGIEQLNKWIEENPEKSTLGILDGDSDKIRIWITLVDYFINNFGVLDCFKLLKELIFLQGNIKKKAAEILQEQREVKEELQQPQSRATVIALESIRRKLSRKRPTS